MTGGVEVVGIFDRVEGTAFAGGGYGDSVGDERRRGQSTTGVEEVSLRKSAE